MPEQYSGLDSLIRGDGEARRYFNSLPGYVQEAVGQRAQSVTSMESLRNYVENLTRGEE